MADGRENSLTLEQWKEGIDNLKALGCGFIAFYGAEPLLEFSKLPQVVFYAESLGIHTTVITNGQVDSFENKIDELWIWGLRSLSMSYDIVPLDKSSEIKMKKTLNRLSCWNTQPGIRDSAAIATLTRTNYGEIWLSAHALSRFGIWTFFDFIHWDRGQPGSKCKNFDGIDKLKFTKNDIFGVIQVLESLAAYKDEMLIHASIPFLEMIQNDPELLIRYDWNCADHEVFPSWVTIDCDGVVYPCDDFQPQYVTGAIYIYEIAKQWETFSDYWRSTVKASCPGCLWNTHIDSHFIKSGKLPFSDYVHI